MERTKKMLDVFDVKNRKDFVEYTLMLMEYILSIFPEDDKTKHGKKYFEEISEDSLTEQISSWKDNITTILDPKKIKYAKAVQIITGTPAQVYHAIAYKDVHVYIDHANSKLSLMIDLSEKLKDDRTSEDVKIKLFKFLDRISKSVFECHKLDIPKVPSREEIKENIQRRKENKVEEAPSMTRAFQTHINSLCAELDIKPILEEVKDDTIRAWMNRWHTFSTSVTDDVQNSSLCHQKNTAVITALNKAFPELKIGSAAITESMWKNINQLNSFSAVNENIPSRMMGRIENMASRLADDIVSGRTDMGSVNLSEIGQQVLSGCSEEDMSSFAGNIDALLPALQQFHANTR
jgi:hypothetical protein